MDHFGIGAAVEGAARVYFQSARRTGRTTALLDSLKDGDRVCCATNEEVRHLLYKCKERGLQVQVITLPTDQAYTIFDRGTPNGRLFFDHGWVERYYLDAFKHIRAQLDDLERYASGSDAAPIDNLASARELAIWGPPTDSSRPAMQGTKP